MKRNKLLFFIFIFCASAYSQSTLKIATFNIQNFGKKKLSQKMIVDTLANIVRKFDIVAVQEISDISNETPGLFLREINKNQYHYKYTCSSRSGKQKDDKSTQEQYAFYYNSDVVTLSKAALYDDSINDYFKREPYVAQFQTKVGNFSFIICTIHTVPKLAVKEIGDLLQVTKWIPTEFTQSKNIILCGDFNASGSYASPLELRALSIHKKPYHWLISDTTKTNLSIKKNCAYDRFVVTDDLFHQVIGYAVLRYFNSKKVSDHWPVYIEIKY